MKTRPLKRYVSKLALAATVLLLAPSAGLAQAATGQSTQAAQPAEAKAATTDAKAKPDKKDTKEGENQLDVGTVGPSKDRLVLKLKSGDKIRFKLIGGYDLSFNLISDEYGRNDLSSSYSFGVNSYLTDKDQLNLRWGLSQQYIADPEEYGLYPNDIRLSYARKFSIPIPEFDIPGRVTLRASAPTSRASIGRGYVSVPTLSLALAPGVGPVTLTASGYYSYHIARYRQAGNGQGYNTLFTAGYSLGASYSPIDWFELSASASMNWRERYPTREGELQPWIPGYSYSLGTSFAIPMPDQAPSLDVGLGYSQGSDLLEGGVYRMYFAKREQSSVGLSISMVY